MRIIGEFILAKFRYLLAIFLVIFNCNSAFARFDSFFEFESFKKSASYVDINDCNVSTILTKILDDPLSIIKSVINPGSMSGMGEMSGMSQLAGNTASPLGAFNLPDCTGTGTTTSGSAVTQSDLCDRRDYFVIDTNELNQTFLPDVVTYPGRAPTPRYVNGSTIYEGAKSKMTAELFIASYAGSVIGFGSGILISIAIMGVEILRIIDVCSNYYVVQPYELVSYARANGPSTDTIYWEWNNMLGYLAQTLASDITGYNVNLDLYNDPANDLTTPNDDSSYWSVGTCNTSTTNNITTSTCTGTCSGSNCTAPSNNIACINGDSCNGGANALTATQVPYFYHCDPNFDPTYPGGTPQGNIANCAPADASCPGWKIGKTWGYMGEFSSYCSDPTSSGQQALHSNSLNEQKHLIGKIQLQGYPYFNILICELSKAVSWINSAWNACVNRGDIQDGNRIVADFNAGDIYSLPTGFSSSKFMAFYRYGDAKEVSPTGQLMQSLRLCVATLDTFLPVIVGCTPVAPPGEDQVESPFGEIIQGTRCVYLAPNSSTTAADGTVIPNADGSTVRPDLASLGNYIGSVLGSDPYSQAKQVRNFLLGDFHFASITVGCVQDMIIKLFVPTVTTNPDGSTASSSSPFQQVQINFRQIVLAALTLFVSLAGVSIMISGEEPNRKQLVGFIMKFALVYFFALGDVWYSSNYGQPGGLITAILGMQDEFASWIGNSGSLYDYLNACTYPPIGGTGTVAPNIASNIFTDTTIPCTAFDGCVPTTTINLTGAIKMTIWDFLDCKIGNYWNFGSCDFSGAGMLSAWFLSIMLFVNINAFLFGLVTIVYFILSLNIIVKFIHSVILSILIIAILAFTAPVFVTFALFEQTKEMCYGWARLLMGYMFYPALIMVFVMIFINTFDRIYYGFTGSNCGYESEAFSVTDPTTPNGIHIQPSNGTTPQPPKATCIPDLNIANIRTGACAGNNSIYCTFLAMINPGDVSACDKAQGTVGNSFVSSKSFSILQILKISFPVSGFIPQWPQFLPVIELLFLTLLFYFLTNTVMMFLGQLVNVQSLTSMASSLTGAITGLAKMIQSQGQMAKGLGAAIKGGGPGGKKKR